MEEVEEVEEDTVSIPIGKRTKKHREAAAVASAAAERNKNRTQQKKGMQKRTPMAIARAKKRAAEQRRAKSAGQANASYLDEDEEDVKMPPRLDRVLPLPPSLPQDLRSMQHVVHSDQVHAGSGNGGNGGGNGGLNFGQSSLRRALWLGRNALQEMNAEEGMEARATAKNNVAVGTHRTAPRPEVSTYGSGNGSTSFGMLEEKQQKPRMPSRQIPPKDARKGKRKKDKKMKKQKDRNQRNKEGHRHREKHEDSNSGMTSYDRTKPGGIGMPPELEKHMGLRQVLTILVVGQYNDVQILLNIVSDNGLRVLAHSRTDGDQLVLGSISERHTKNVSQRLPKTPPHAAKILRTFLQVASSFALIFHRPDPSSTRVLGAGELGGGSPK